MACPSCTYDDNMVRFDIYCISSNGERYYHQGYQVLDPETDHNDLARIRKFHKSKTYLISPHDARSATALMEPKDEAAERMRRAKKLNERARTMTRNSGY